MKTPWPLREALTNRKFPPLPSRLKHLLNFPYFVHISTKDPTCWAYTPTPQHGEQDRQVRLAPGKLLNRVTNLKDHEIRDIIAEYQRYLAREFPVYELKWAKTQEAVQNVYENLAPEDMENAFGNAIEEGDPLNDVCAEGSNYPSCMGHGEGDYDGDFHPARVYGSSPDGSIAVAYIEDHLGIVARTVCSTIPKTYVRVYQRYKTEGAEHLEGLLEAQGYSQSRHLKGTVRAIWYDEPERLHMPYLDWETRFDLASRDGMQVVIFGLGGDYENTRTGGTAEMDDARETCECCGEWVDETIWIEFDNQAVCDYCLGEYYTYAYTGRHQNYVSNDDVYYCEDTGEYYTEDAFEYHNLVWDYNEDLRDLNSVVWIESLSEYFPSEKCFEDGEGEMRAFEEVDLSWWVTSDGILYEMEPEGEVTIELGTYTVLMFWFRPWVDCHMTPFVDVEVSGMVRRILGSKPEPQTYESLARRYAIEIPEDGYPVWEGRTWKVRPKTREIFAWLESNRELEVWGEREANPSANPEPQPELALAA